MRKAILIISCCVPVLTIADFPQIATVPVTKHCLQRVEETIQKHNTDMCHHAQYTPFTQINLASPDIVGYIAITEKVVNDPAWASRCRLIFTSKASGWLYAFASECRTRTTPTVQRTKNLSKDLETLAEIVERAEARGVTEHHITINRDSISTKYYYEDSILKSPNKPLEPTR